MDYLFTVTATKGVFGSTSEWSGIRSDNASCAVSTSVLEIPSVSVTPKVIRRVLAAIETARS